MGWRRQLSNSNHVKLQDLPSKHERMSATLQAFCFFFSFFFSLYIKDAPAFTAEHFRALCCMQGENNGTEFMGKSQRLF